MDRCSWFGLSSFCHKLGHLYGVLCLLVFIDWCSLFGLFLLCHELGHVCGVLFVYVFQWVCALCVVDYFAMNWAMCCVCCVCCCNGLLFFVWFVFILP